eukprot:2688029-Prymnesium_polylepis.2
MSTIPSPLNELTGTVRRKYRYVDPSLNSGLVAPDEIIGTCVESVTVDAVVAADAQPGPMMPLTPRPWNASFSCSTALTP